KDVEGVHLCPEVTVIPGIVPAHEMADSRRLMAPGKRRDAHELMVDPVGCRGYINRPASGMERHILGRDHEHPGVPQPGAKVPCGDDPVPEQGREFFHWVRI